MEKLTSSSDLFGGLPAVTKASAKWPKDYRERFWSAYPRKVAKATAMKSLDRVMESGVEFEKIMTAVARYSAWLAQRDANNWRPEPRHPATWLNGGCWDDELPAVASKAAYAKPSFLGAARAAMANGGFDGGQQ